MPQETDFKFFMKVNKIFAPTDIFKGYSLAEVHHEPDLMNQVIEAMNDIQDDKPVKLIKSISRVPRLIYNPLEFFLSSEPNPDLAKRILDGDLYYTSKDVVRRNINMESPLQLAFDSRIDESNKEYGKFDYFEDLLKLVFESQMDE